MGIVSVKNRKDVSMKKQTALFTHYAQKINSQHVQLVFTLLALAMLVIGVGAPNEGGGIGPR